MSDKKISQLTSLDNTTVAADDLLPIVDVSETGIARSKKITLQNLQDSPINAISASITATAVDVFVYDTRKDSDGGAWRKRTQHTSWYNETLNTAIRGSRREFPAVAVIVAESNKVTIYDGDDPAMPMWMVFNVASGGFLYTTAKAIYAVNGLFVCGTDGSASQCDFIKDNYFFRNANGTLWNKEIVVNRNKTGGPYSSGVIPPIVNSTVNDVAMTVLPNAPIDAATGLPIPTIAVATAGGVSVIKDDGTVVDIGITQTAKGTNDISFIGDRIAFSAQQSSSDTSYWRYIVAPIPTGDISGAYWQSFASSVLTDYSYSYYTAGEMPYLGVNAYNTADIYAADGLAVGGNTGLAVLAEDTQTPANGMVDYITSTYNTGWMPGAIKGAWLSDTDATNVTGAELVTNGTFDTDISGWTNGTSISSAVVSGQVQVTRSGGVIPTAAFEQNVTVEVGKLYAISIDVVVDNGAARCIDNGSTGQLVNAAGFGGTGTFVFYVRATTTTLGINLWTNDGTTSTFDNISVRLADADRSVNNKGLQVFGTVTKSPVATGADLVAYSGFSASNYLQQPYNSDLDFGTGDFCVMGWFNLPAGNSQYQIIDRKDGVVGTGGAWQVKVENTSQKLYFAITDDYYATRDEVLSSMPVDTGAWTFGCAVRSGSTIYIYVNGGLAGSTAITNATGSLSKVGAKLFVGIVYGGLIPFAGSLALWRISATAPTAAQIAKIYEDEKVLFQDGAQATLYGASDAVTALAYDEDTNLLHVGTSAGRSDFQGLRRVNNTTTAVGVALSASNGMIVEE